MTSGQETEWALFLQPQSQHGATNVWHVENHAQATSEDPPLGNLA